MDLKSLGEQLELILCSTIDPFSLQQIVDELRDYHGIDAQKIAEKFGNRNFKELFHNEFSQLIECKRLENGELIYRGKWTAKSSQFKKEQFKALKEGLPKIRKEIDRIERELNGDRRALSAAELKYKQNKLKKLINKRTKMTEQLNGFEEQIMAATCQQNATPGLVTESVTNETRVLQNNDFLCSKSKSSSNALTTQHREQHQSGQEVAANVVGDGPDQKGDSTQDNSPTVLMALSSNQFAINNQLSEEDKLQMIAGLRDNFERTLRHKDARHAQEISTLNAQLQQERNGHIKIANELKQVKIQQMEQFSLLRQENATLKFKFREKTNEARKDARHAREISILNAQLEDERNERIQLAKELEDVKKYTRKLSIRRQHPQYELMNNEDLAWSLANRWIPTREGYTLRFSDNGLNVKRLFGSMGSGFVRGFYGPSFAPVRQAGPLIYYYETKYLKGIYSYGFCAKDYNHEPVHMPPDSFGLMSDTGKYFHGTDGRLDKYEHQDFIPYTGSAIVGCGLLKHFGQYKIFFTRNGQLLAKPICLPSSVTDEVGIYPFINLRHFNDVCQFEDTNFGHRPFMFKFEENVEKLSEEMITSVNTSES